MMVNISSQYIVEHQSAFKKVTFKIDEHYIIFVLTQDSPNACILWTAD